jgi:hypothetical protein
MKRVRLAPLALAAALVAPLMVVGDSLAAEPTGTPASGSGKPAPSDAAVQACVDQLLPLLAWLAPDAAAGELRAQDLVDRAVTECLDPGGDPCAAEYAATVQSQRRRAALDLVAGAITPAQYLGRARDRTRKLGRATDDPAWRAAWCQGDQDEDLVGNAFDRCPSTSPGVATRDNGCFDAAADRPAAPPRKDVDAALASMGLVASPACAGAPVPNIPAPLAIKVAFTTHFNTRYITSRYEFLRTSNQPPGCAVLYELETYENGLGTPRRRSRVLRAGDNAAVLPQDAGKFVTKRGLYLESASPEPRVPSHFRVRAMNGNGVVSPWSAPYYYFAKDRAARP